MADEETKIHNKDIKEMGDLVTYFKEELTPNLFYLGFRWGSKFQDIFKIKEMFDTEEEAKEYIDLYHKGQKNLSNNMKIGKCPKCKKTIQKSEIIKFCQYCGFKLK